MQFKLLSFVANLFKKTSTTVAEGEAPIETPVPVVVVNNYPHSEMEMPASSSGSNASTTEDLDQGVELMDTSDQHSIVENVDGGDGYGLEAEEGELIEMIDENGAVMIDAGDDFLIGEEDEVIEIVEGEEFTSYEESVPEENLGTYLSAEIDETQVAETVIDSTAGTYEGEEDKEIGESIIQSEFVDETDTEPILEIARRRLSHEGNCYCGKDRNLNIAELLCASCHRWYHESCIGYQLGKLVPFTMNYVFICKNCSPTGLESFKRSQAQFAQMCVTAIANLTQASVKDCSNRQRFSKDVDIIPFIDMHWEGMTPMRRVSQSWQTSITRTLLKDSGSLFTCEQNPADPHSPYFGLLAMDLTQIRPNYEAMIKSGQLKLADINSGGLFRRGGGKRRTVGGLDMFAQSQAAVAKKTRGDVFLAKSVLGHGYPSEHPFNKDGYRYVLAEPDSNAPFRQEFDESSDWAGKPIPGWLYRVLTPPFVFLALHDRATQLKVSEDRLSVTGEKGYCMIRASHFVTKGSWFWEAKITELPESAACRIGWGQAYANLQAPLGFDKFGYSWRSRLGTKFHQAIGKSYCKGGYTIDDVLGFLIILPEPESHKRKIFGPMDPLSVPESFKDRPLVRFKSHLYYEDKDISAEVEINEIRPGSKIISFKNGVCQGVKYENIFEGSYYPSIALYKGCTVKANFGPIFEYPPSKDEFTYKAYQERAEDAIIEQTMSDILFLTENDGVLSLDNAVPIPN